MDQCEEVERLQARAAQSQHRLQMLGAQERALQVLHALLVYISVHKISPLKDSKILCTLFS